MALRSSTCASVISNLYQRFPSAGRDPVPCYQNKIGTTIDQSIVNIHILALKLHHFSRFLDSLVKNKQPLYTSCFTLPNRISLGLKVLNGSRRGQCVNYPATAEQSLGKRDLYLTSDVFSGAQHGVTASSACVIGVRRALRRPACIAAHRERPRRPRRTHRRTRLRPLHREVPTCVRDEVFPIENH